MFSKMPMVRALEKISTGTMTYFVLSNVSMVAYLVYGRRCKYVVHHLPS